MSVVIRLSKTGRKGEAKYRVVVKEKRSRRDGSAIETLGWFEKKEKQTLKNIDDKRLEYWISKGAHVTPAVKKTLQA
ncbi:MAG: 30S ribosomal protein S16 [Candidatus Levybacteria bacterium RIFCSPHIGHO2_12_FULL_38_12]|nr:MAG: 30S ribosomal protein S16 [Candidatus Levybacteria bacterium RIFCSPHIGHO2_01_FULL_38_12]OGH22065.1 MAG: 30S ribosomal protein S16 [Candidatus Levybacteria bacterium RIFCSPHIGHO2_02_FULL_37_18]OGH22919.1 MAG: 30S ribosomal protein S16 [Candidatus Levybacteria bacterium RIFCSPHIGHO2_12_FULL_38_12]OGH34037.1 MAG: 30S ribosomal protein S16 [Candidatus Levybacteria bacterium RIFCSPLOWO2_01_FULL_37_20]OGH44897.1 MAG: 30S ribosomal protein S16 [Candidatus Levybacteria bacterium RIFCSPLOWO2_02_